MATTTEIRAQIGQLQTSIAGVKGQLSGVNANINQLRQDQALAQAAGNSNQATLLSQQRAVLTEESAQLSQTLRSLEGQLATAQIALSESENQVQPQNQTSTNADGTVTTATGGDTNLNPPVRTIEQVQASTDQNGNNVGIALPDETGTVGTIRRNPESGELYDTGGLYAPTSPGVGANDDSGANGGLDSQGGQSGDAEAQEGGFYGEAQTSNTATISGTVTSNSRPQIKPRPNVLDKFSSYTYRISVYLMTPSQYRTLARSNKKNINGYNLLFQSGGAPVNVGGFQGALNPNAATVTAGVVEATESELAGVLSRNIPGAGAADAGRNPAFPLDFYIDSCYVTNLLQGKSTTLAHSTTEIKFTVIEPVGITLIDRLYEAVRDAAPLDSSRTVNYAAAHYLMAIRFYGYDQNGNIISDNPNNSDPRAVIEKLITFQIRRINWRVQSKATEYEFDCVATNQLIALSTRRGMVPYDIQLTQGTVGALLAGPLQATEQPLPANPRDRALARGDLGTPPKAAAAGTPKPLVQQGLMSAMNEFNRKLVTDNVYEIADEYEIVFAPGAEAIRDATIVLPDTKKQAQQTGMAQQATANANSLDPDKQRKDTSVASRMIVAGQPLVQVIDTVIRNSSYITNQALTLYDDDKDVANDDNKQKQKPVDWYRIDFQVVPIGDVPDSKRNDFAYKIRYVISTYRIDNYDSKYFPLGTFRGVHKSYPWWFTGANTAVIDYTETLNSAYNVLISGSSPAESNAERYRRKIAQTMRELVFYTYGPASDESRQGSRYKSNEPSANLADSLYGGADLASTKLRIVGDPAWMQQGVLPSNIAGDLGINTLQTSFLPDGTINYDAEQVMFEVTWNRPADYNLQTGIADPNTAQSLPVSRVYTARRVVNEFVRGKFEQVIDGALFQLPKPDGSNKAPGAAMPTVNNQQATASGAIDTGGENPRDRMLARRPGPTNLTLPTSSATPAPPPPPPVQTLAQRQVAASESYRRAAQQAWGRNRPQPGPENTPQVSDPVFSSWDP